jgi:hypothetical protein
LNRQRLPCSWCKLVCTMSEQLNKTRHYASKYRCTIGCLQQQQQRRRQQQQQKQNNDDNDDDDNRIAKHKHKINNEYFVQIYSYSLLLSVRDYYFFVILLACCSDNGNRKIRHNCRNKDCKQLNFEQLYLKYPGFSNGSISSTTSKHLKNHRVMMTKTVSLQKNRP